MKSWALGLGAGALALALLPACGGQTEGGGSSDPGESTPDKQPAPSDTSSPSSGIDNPDADTDLGDCKLGPFEYGNGDAPCPWATDNRCYQTREMACNCACPRSHDSQCVSGFDAGSDGHVLVSCF